MSTVGCIHLLVSLLQMSAALLKTQAPGEPSLRGHESADPEFYMSAAELASADRDSGLGPPTIAWLKPGTESLFETPHSPIRNFTEAGLCYADPMEDAVKKNWGLIVGDFQRGRKQAAETRILFTGVISNAEPIVMGSYKTLKWLGLNFKDYHFLLYQHDTTDNTDKFTGLLADLDDKYEVRKAKDKPRIGDSRVKRMAIVRNRLHKLIFEFLDPRPQWNLVFMYDFGMNVFGSDPFSPHMFLAALGRKESLEGKWDMLCANSLRRQGRRPDAPAGFHGCVDFRTDRDQAESCHLRNSTGLFAEYGLLPVHSCFGGLALYRRQSFLTCKYEPNATDSEHVSLHKCMNDHGSRGRMFMDPLLTTAYDYRIAQTCSAAPVKKFDARITATNATKGASCPSHCHTSKWFPRCTLPECHSCKECVTQDPMVPRSNTAVPPAVPTSTEAPLIKQRAAVRAYGDPHLVNIYREKFDIYRPGVHTLIHVPKLQPPSSTLLKVSAEAQQIGGACADLYFQAINITGRWVPKSGGLHFRANRPWQAYSAKWLQFSNMSLKVVWGHTSGGVKYLNLMVKHLNQVNFPIGGLLGEDDHTVVSTPKQECKRTTWL